MAVNTKNWQELKKTNSLDIKSGGDNARTRKGKAKPIAGKKK